MNILAFIFFTLFFLGVIGIIINRRHLLSALLCLDLLLISLFLNISSWINIFSSFNYILFSILLLTFSACEASAGLSIMVSISRSHNSDLLTNINLLHV
uniref:NADH-ubiquinone oxidoreductase chain 4L n=1 Tax=Peniagone sp. YYH-2013 TaxID=1430316 RepID=W5W500_9ECHN|nr:NADH dehydrogenase subunit 4L [Peniagone sp. YYH-2013]